MADICVIYKSEDQEVTEHLVKLLRRNWSTWWSPDTAHGDWEEQVRTEVPRSKMVIAVLSEHINGDKGAILKDEMTLAKNEGIPLLPFLIGPTTVPLGFGRLDHVKAYGWTGNGDAEEFKLLSTKIKSTIGRGEQASIARSAATSTGEQATVHRASELLIGRKILQLPAFVFSLSSHETQVSPLEGAEILNLFQPEAILLSSYDAWKYHEEDKDFNATLKTIRDSKSVLFLDSGNYESYRKEDVYSRKNNPNGWRQKHYQKKVVQLRPDLVFSFDQVNPTGTIEQISQRIITSVRADEKSFGQLNVPICPIVHLPKKHLGTIEECASALVSAVASDLNPLMIAIPERELGHGIIAKTKAVRQIRKSLNKLGKYYPLHLLGTGNPLSMVALAASGADSFDGLEWCRTVADYERGYLFHFQQFEFFSQTMAHKIQDPQIRKLVSNSDLSYGMRVLAYNIDFFRDHTQTLQNLIHSGQIKTLLKMLPGIGSQLQEELSK